MGIEKSKAMAKRARLGALVEGRKVATAANGMMLVKVGRAVKRAAAPEEQAQVLVLKAARALNRPGIKKEVVFRGPGIYSYSINPKDSTQFIREDASGSRTLGYMRKGKFLVAKTPASAS